MESITIYEPDHRLKTGLWYSLGLMLRNVINTRELIWQLIRRDFLMSYKRSFLGKTWIFVSPLLAIIAWVFYNYVGVLQPGFSEVPYPIYVLLSSSMWNLFMGYFRASSRTLEAGVGLLTQIKYPHEAMLFKECAQEVFNFSIGFLMNIIVIVIFSISEGQSYLHWQLILLPILCFPLLLLGAAIGLILVPLKAVLPDISKAFTSLMGLLIFITPVIYSDKIENVLMQKIMKYNPLTYLIGAPRDMIFYGSYDHWLYYGISCILSLLGFISSWRLFFLVEERLIERMI